MVLKSVSAFEVVTQFEIVVNGRRYFADIAIPGLMIIFEFDGIGKLGKDDAEFARAKRDWIQRENDLRSAGWTIYRVSWRTTKTSLHYVRGQFSCFVRIKLPSLSVPRRCGLCRLLPVMVRAGVFMSTCDEWCTS